MLTRKNWRLCFVTVAGACLLAGCGPGGPKALVEGDRLVGEGKYAEAIPLLKRATVALPTEARAWNALGLAYHGSGDYPDAIHSYHQALTLSNNLAVARFNLGSALMTQANFAAAAAEFTTYTLLQPKDVNGWLKRGGAELRARQFDAAERSYRISTNLNPRLPEAYNALGIIQLNRGHPRDSVPLLTTALQMQAKYAPALLNLAIVEHYYLPARPIDYRPFALQKYNEYLALNPRPANADHIEAIARQLSLELNPPKPVPANPVVQTNRTGNAVAPAPIITTAPPRLVETATNPPARTEVIPPPPVARAVTAPALEVATPPATPKVEAPPAPVKSVEVPVPNPVEPAKVATTYSETAAPANSAAAQNPPTTPATGRTNKTGFLQTINPLNLFHRDTKPPAVTPVPSSPGSTLKLAQVEGADRPVPTVDPANFPRYHYKTSKIAAPGDRAAADTEIENAKRAQRDGLSKEAIAASRKAVKADPAYFTAHFNLGLVANDAGDLDLALTAYQNALAIEPASVAARFNFALALQRAGYLLDAEAELAKLLEGHPDEPRAHLALANLYSQKLGQPAKAREHYQAVLRLDPGNAQATEIRYWLKANP